MGAPPVLRKNQLNLFGQKPPSEAPAPEAAPAVEPAVLPGSERPLAEPATESLAAPGARALGGGDEPSAEAAELGPLPTLPGAPRKVEPYLFPPQEEVRRIDMHFSRRMSDLVRRLQLLERQAKQELHLTLPQAHAIHALDDAGSLRMQELAAALGLAQSTVTRLVAPLKRVGLLDRRPDRNDGRATRAFLTDAGKAAVDGLESADRELYKGLLDRIPATRRAEVVAAIELLHEVVLTTLQPE